MLWKGIRIAIQWATAPGSNWEKEKQKTSLISYHWKAIFFWNIIGNIPQNILLSWNCSFASWNRTFENFYNHSLFFQSPSPWGPGIPHLEGKLPVLRQEKNIRTPGNAKPLVLLCSLEIHSGTISLALCNATKVHLNYFPSLTVCSQFSVSQGTASFTR